MESPRVSRRELLAAGAAVAAGLGLQAPATARARTRWYDGIDFRGLPAGDGWAGWTCPGAANLRRAGGLGVLEAGSDVFPCDPRPVAFMVDRRARDGEIAAVLRAAGAGAGLVLRRTGPRDYYAAVYDSEQSALILLRRTPDGVVELARAGVAGTGERTRLWFRAAGASPTTLTATLQPAGGAAVGVSAVDGAAPLQAAGDPGVLATARTLFPHAGPPVLPALGNLHLLPWGVQEGQAFMASPAGKPIMDAIRERSTAVFEEIAVQATGRRGITPPSVIAATSGRPLARGAAVRVATDVPARVRIEVSRDASFRRSRIVDAGLTGEYEAAIVALKGLSASGHWRARVRRRGKETVGPARSFNRAISTVAIGSCASQFGPAFEQIAARRPDVFLWQGDLNYPDTMGPLAQTTSGYAGIWRDFLANPLMEPVFERTLFAVQRDDHDYGLQDANSTNLVPWGLTPWEALMEPRTYYRFRAGPAELWVLDQRLHKSDPALPDTPAKTLLGAAQRDWLLKTLAASKAAFKVVCSPCTLAPLDANARDGSWASGFGAERDLLLAHVRERVSGRTIFVTGDTHWTMVYEHDGLTEFRPCPLGIPTPNDITLTQPNVAEDARAVEGVLYADDERGHFALLTARDGALQVEIVRDDGAVVHQRRFER